MPSTGLGPVFVPTAAWLRANTSHGPGEAASVLRTSRLLDEAPAASDAAEAGELGMEQATIVARTLKQLDAAHERRGLRLTPDVDGMTRVRGLLDPAERRPHFRRRSDC